MDGPASELAPPQAGQRWKIGFSGQVNFCEGLDILLEGIRLATERGAEVEIGIHEKMSMVHGFPDHLDKLAVSIKALGKRATFHEPYHQAEVH